MSHNIFSSTTEDRVQVSDDERKNAHEDDNAQETNWDDISCKEKIGFECQLSTEEEQLVSSSAYFINWIIRSGLKVLKPDEVKRAL